MYTFYNDDRVNTLAAEFYKAGKDYWRPVSRHMPFVEGKFHSKRLHDTNIAATHRPGDSPWVLVRFRRPILPHLSR